MLRNDDGPRHPLEGGTGAYRSHCTVLLHAAGSTQLLVLPSVVVVKQNPIGSVFDAVAKVSKGLYWA
jgi:hypothetical protein